MSKQFFKLTHNHLDIGYDGIRRRKIHQRSQKESLTFKIITGLQQSHFSKHLNIFQITQLSVSHMCPIFWLSAGVWPTGAILRPSAKRLSKRTTSPEIAVAWTSPRRGGLGPGCPALPELTSGAICFSESFGFSNKAMLLQLFLRGSQCNIPKSN